MEKWCEHMIMNKIVIIPKDIVGVDIDINHWYFCPICGTPRPVEKKVKLVCPRCGAWGSEFQTCTICGTEKVQEKKVELPKKFYEPTANSTMCAFNQLIDYLASKPWVNS